MPHVRHINWWRVQQLELTTNVIMWIFLLGTDHTYVNHPAAHIHPLIFCLCGCLLCVLTFESFSFPPWGAVLDADLLRVTTWPTYPQTTLMDQFVCVACGQTFLTGVCWINEQPRFFTIVDFSVWLSAGFLSSFLIVSNQAQREKSSFNEDPDREFLHLCPLCRFRV